MLFVYFILTVLGIISLGKSQVTCADKDVARQKFSYYTPWYRFTHGLIFWTTRKICALTEDESKFVCAQVAQACFESLREIPVEHIEKEMKTTPGPCKKEEYTTPKKGGDFQGGMKKMFPCPKYTVSGKEVASFFVSYGGSANTALIFDRDATKNMDINAEPQNERGVKSFIKLAYYVTGLQLGKPENNNPDLKKTTTQSERPA